MEREPENEVPETFLEVIRWKAGTFPQEAPIARRAGGLEDLGGTDKGVSTIARRAGGLGTTKFMVSGPPFFLTFRPFSAGPPSEFRRGRRDFGRAFL